MEDDHEIYDYFDNNYQGYLLAEVHTPIKKQSKDGKSLQWSWGTATFTLIVATAMKDLVKKSCAWADRKEKELLIGYLEKTETE